MRRGLMVALCAMALTTSAKTLVFHLDLNTVHLNRETIERTLEHVAKSGYTAILWEVEDAVRWESCPEAAAADAYSKKEFCEILAKSERLGLEPIPLLQTLGHAEYVLGNDKYRHLRENHDRKNAYCPSKPASRRLIKGLLREYLELFGSRVRRFHLGGDEVWGFGLCESCKRRKPIELYVEHLCEIAEALRERGIRPGVWHDMIMHFDPTGKSYARLPRDFSVWYWNYAHPDGNGWGKGVEGGLRAEIVAGREVFYCGSVQCSIGDPFFVRYGLHRENLRGSIEDAQKEGFAGYCVTSWSRHQSSKVLQYPLVDFAAKRYLNPGTVADDDWREIIERYFGCVPVSALDEMTAYEHTMIDADGRYVNDYKDGAIAPRGSIRTKFAGRETEARRLASLAQCLAAGTKEGADVLRRIPEKQRGPLAETALEAADLKMTWLRAEAAGLTREPMGNVPLERTRIFYSREQTPESAEKCAMRIYSAYLGQ